MKKLNKFEFSAAASRSSYEWDTLLDGGFYLLKHGEDYDCEFKTIYAMTRNKAAARGQSVKVQEVRCNDKGQIGENEKDFPNVGVVIQAQGKPDAAKAEAYKAKRKAAMAKRKEAKKAEKNGTAPAAAKATGS